MTSTDKDHDHYTAELVNGAIFALAHAGDDIRRGRYGIEEKRTLASGLEKLVKALRHEDLPVVISSS